MIQAAQRCREYEIIALRQMREGQLIFTPEMRLQPTKARARIGATTTTPPHTLSEPHDFRSHRCDYSDLCVAKSVFRSISVRWFSFNIVLAYRSIFLMNFVSTVPNVTNPQYIFAHDFLRSAICWLRIFVRFGSCNIKLKEKNAK